VGSKEAVIVGEAVMNMGTVKSPPDRAMETFFMPIVTVVIMITVGVAKAVGIYVVHN
jgi:hypothetical protein